MTLAEIAALLGLNLALSLAVMAAAWAVSVRTGRSGFLDGLWPLVMLLGAATTWLLIEGDPVRKALLLWLTAVWAAREAWRALSPAARRESDIRYAAAFDGRGSGKAALLVACFLPQGALAWLIALPAQLGQIAFSPSVGIAGWTGAGLAVAGLALAGLGDRRPATAAAERGWRRWLRRPDHLGDLMVWWGLYGIAAETAPGRWSIVGPLLLTLLLAHRTLTENPRRERDGG